MPRSRFDFTRNPKQAQYFNDVLMAAKGATPYRYFFYGGAVRGGKTSVALVTLYFLSRIYAGSRWVIIGASDNDLRTNTIPSWNKFFAGSSHIERAYNSAGNTYVKFKNGSEIHFKTQNAKQDPDLDWMLGMECNGIFLEQCEKLTETCWNRSLERIGSWYIDNMPVPMIFATFNPTKTWVRRITYDLWKDSKLDEPFYYLNALPSDNAFVTDEQWAAWERMDKLTFRRMIEGDWDAFAGEKLWAHSFSTRNIGENLEIDKKLPVYLSFDFNVDPMTCGIIQQGPDWINIIEEITISDSDIYEMCARIKAKFDPGILVRCTITGDASGKNRSAMAKGKMRNFYKVIMSELKVRKSQIKGVWGVNPRLEDSWLLTNAMLDNFPELLIDAEKCPMLIADLEQVEKLPDYNMDKAKDKRRTHCLDWLRYFLWTFHRGWIKW